MLWCWKGSTPGKPKRPSRSKHAPNMMASKGASREAEGKVSEREEGDAEIHQERTAHDTKPCNWKFVFMHVYTSSHSELEADV